MFVRADQSTAYGNVVQVMNRLREAHFVKVGIFAETAEQGPPHDRTFAVAAMVTDRILGTGSGRSKKDAEQAAAEAALESLTR